MPPEVKVRLTVEGTPEALAAFRQTQAEAHKLGRGGAAALAPLNAALATTTRLLAGMVSVVALIQATKAVANFTAETARAARETGDAAKELGTTASAYSALEVVAKRAGKSPDVMNKGLGILAQRIDALRAGEPAATAAFRRLGLSVKDFPGDDIAQNADIVARALARFEASGTRSALATAVLGRQGRELIPVFEKLAAMGGLEGAIGYARSTGQLIDEATVAALEALAEAMARLKMEAGSAALQFMRGFGPEATAAIESLADAIDVSGIGALQRFGEVAGKVMRFAVAGVRSLAAEWDYTSKLASVNAAAWSRFFKAGGFTSPTAYSFAWNSGIDLAAKDLKQAMLARRKVLEQEAASEWEIRVQQMQRDQEGDDRLLKAKKIGLEQYLKNRAERIERETNLERDFLEMQIATLRGAPQFREIQDQIRQWEERIDALGAERARRLKEGAPEGFQTPGAPAARAATRELQAGEARLRAQKAANDALEAKAKAAYEAGNTSLQEYYDVRLEMIQRNETAELDLLTEKWAAARMLQDPKARKDALDALSAQTDEVMSRADKERADTAAALLKDQQQLEKNLGEISAERMKAEGEEHRQVLQHISEQMEAYQKLLIQAGMLPEDAAIRAAANAGAASSREDFRVDLAAAKADLEKVSALGATPEDVARLRALAEALRTVALAIGPDAVKSVDDLNGKITALKTPTTFLTDEVDALRGAFAGFFGSTITGFKSATDAARGFLLMLAQVTMQVLATRWATALFGAPGKKATGGLVFGPGTGTSDSVPTLLSRGEYVVRASMVERPGVLTALERINRGALVAPIRMPGYGVQQLERMAAGGQVGGRSGSSELGGSLTLVVPEGVGVESPEVFMRSPKGKRLAVQIAIEHRRILRQGGVG